MKLSSRATRIKPSPTLAITAKAQELRAKGRDIIGFGAGEPDFDTPANIKQAAIRAIDEGFTKYTPVGGIEDLKDAIIAKLKKDNGLEYKRSQVFVSCGAKHSLYNIAQVLFESGDEVIVPAPYWVSYPDIVVLADATPVIVQTSEKNGFKLDPADLKKAITQRTKAVVINSPSNPTGATYTAAELGRIAEVISEKNIIAISDDIYEKILYDGMRFTDIASCSSELRDLTIVVNGVSKSHAMTGWRIGYAAGPENVIKAATDFQSQNTSNPTSIAQKAAVEALKGSQDTVAMMVGEFQKRRDFIVDGLNNIPGVNCLKPEGAFYVFPNVSGLFGKSCKGTVVKSSSDVTEFLLENADVAVVPGVVFGNDNHIRLSYATSLRNIEEGLKRIKAAVG
jgi:aspartate aminotransferase